MAFVTLCGILSPVVYIAADITAARRYPGFSYTDQAVSELFAIGAPTSGFIVRWFTVSSVLLLVFAAGAWRATAGSRSRRFMAGMLALSGVNALVLWNAFPMHMRGDEKSLTDTMHLVLAANPFWAASLIAAIVGFRGAFRAYSIATLCVLLALGAYGFSFAAAVAADAPTPWMGLAERLAQYLDGVWQAVLAVVMHRSIITVRSRFSPAIGGEPT
jgi:hypothetical membrane protein